MLNDILYVVWDCDPVMFSIGGFELRYYGLAWALTLLLGERFFTAFSKREGFGPQIVETGFLWIALGAVLGARIGHCLFYDFAYYSAHPIEIFTGIRDGGMASHGSALGMLLGMWITSRKYKMPYVWWLDRIMIPVSIGGAMVRIGNLINSEIVGNVTNLPWGFKFVRNFPGVPVENIPVQHPSQLYEALCYFTTFIILMWMYYKKDFGRKRAGIMFGVGLVGIFVTRFFIEFFKVNQEAFEEGMTLNMGQLLSVPFIVVAALVIWYVVKGKFNIGTPKTSQLAARVTDKKRK